MHNRFNRDGIVLTLPSPSLEAARLIQMIDRINAEDLQARNRPRNNHDSLPRPSIDAALLIEMIDRINAVDLQARFRPRNNYIQNLQINLTGFSLATLFFYFAFFTNFFPSEDKTLNCCENLLRFFVVIGSIVINLTTHTHFRQASLRCLAHDSAYRVGRILSALICCFGAFSTCAYWYPHHRLVSALKFFAPWSDHFISPQGVLLRGPVLDFFLTYGHYLWGDCVVGMVLPDPKRRKMNMPVPWPPPQPKLIRFLVLCILWPLMFWFALDIALIVLQLLMCEIGFYLSIFAAALLAGYSISDVALRFPACVACIFTASHFALPQQSSDALDPWCAAIFLLIGGAREAFVRRRTEERIHRNVLTSLLLKMSVALSSAYWLGLQDPLVELAGFVRRRTEERTHRKVLTPLLLAMSVALSSAYWLGLRDPLVEFAGRLSSLPLPVACTAVAAAHLAWPHQVLALLGAPRRPCAFEPARRALKVAAVCAAFPFIGPALRAAAALWPLVLIAAAPTAAYLAAASICGSAAGAAARAACSSVGPALRAAAALWSAGRAAAAATTAAPRAVVSLLAALKRTARSIWVSRSLTAREGGGAASARSAAAADERARSEGERAALSAELALARAAAARWRAEFAAAAASAAAAREEAGAAREALAAAEEALAAAREVVLDPITEVGAMVTGDWPAASLNERCLPPPSPLFLHRQTPTLPPSLARSLPPSLHPSIRPFLHSLSSGGRESVVTKGRLKWRDG
jgi:hypothetical protein